MDADELSIGSSDRNWRYCFSCPRRYPRSMGDYQKVSMGIEKGS